MPGPTTPKDIQTVATPSRMGPTFQFLGLSGNVLSDLRFGVWERLSGMADTDVDLPANLIDSDENNFRVVMIDSAGSVKESKPSVSVCFARNQNILGSITAELTKKGQGRFESKPLMLVTEGEELHDPGGMEHSQAHRMLEAHLDGEVFASYPGAVSPHLAVGSQTRTYRAHIFAVTQHQQAPSGSIDPLFGRKQSAALAQHFRARHIYERLCMRLRAVPYAGIDPSDLITTAPLSDGSPLHVVRAPTSVDTNAMNTTTMANLAAKYPAQDGIARVFVVGNFGLRGLAFTPMASQVALDPQLRDACFVNCVNSTPFTMAHELGHLLLTDHMSNDYCLMNEGTVDHGSWRSSKWVYSSEFNSWPNRPLTSP
jgi:hypothetical protein